MQMPLAEWLFSLADVANSEEGKVNPKTQVQTPNLGHPPRLYSSARRKAEIPLGNRRVKNLESTKSGPPAGEIYEGALRRQLRSGVCLSRLLPFLLVDHVVKVGRSPFDIGMLVLAGAAFR